MLTVEEIRSSTIAGTPISGLVSGSDPYEAIVIFAGDLRQALSDEDVRTSGRYLRIENATISGPLDLDFFHIAYPVAFKSVEFQDSFSMEFAHVRALFLDECSFGELDLTGLVVEASLWMSSCSANSLCLDLVSCNASIALLDCDFGLDFQREPAVSMERIHVSGNLTAEKICAKSFTGRGLHVEGDLSFRGSYVFSEDHGVTCVDLSMARVGGDLSFDKNWFAGCLSLFAASVAGGMEIDGTKLLNPNYYCLSLEQAQISGFCYLGDENELEGSVSLIRSKFGSDLRITIISHKWGDLATLSARDTVIGDRIAIVGDLLSSDSSVWLTVKVRGQLRFPGCSVRGQVNIIGAAVGDSISDSVVLADGRALGGVAIHDGTFFGAINLSSMRESGRLSIERVTVRGNRERSIDVHHAVFSDAVYLGTSSLLYGINADQLTCIGELHLFRVRIWTSDHVAIRISRARMHSLAIANSWVIGGGIEAIASEISGQMQLFQLSVFADSSPAFEGFGLSVKNDLRVEECTFVGLTSLIGAHVGGTVEFFDSLFSDGGDDVAALVIDNSTSERYFLIRSVHFMGRIRSKGIKVGGDLIIGGSQVIGAEGSSLYLSGSSVEGRVLISVSDFCSGAIDMSSCRLSGGVDFQCSQVSFGDGKIAIYLDFSEILGVVSIPSADAVEGDFSALGASISGQLVLGIQSDFEDSSPGGAILQNATIDDLVIKGALSHLDLTGASIRSLYLPSAGKLATLSGAAGMSIKTIHAASFSASRAAEWLTSAPTFQPGPWDELAAAMVRSGDAVNGRRLLMLKERERSKKFPLWRKGIGWISEVFTGRNFYPLRALAAMFMLACMACLVADMRADSFGPTDTFTLPESQIGHGARKCPINSNELNGESPSSCLPASYPKFNPMTYGLLNMLPGTVSGETSWKPIRKGGDVTQLEMKGIALLIWITTAYVAAGATGLIRRVGS